MLKKVAQIAQLSVVARLGWSYTAYGDFHYQDSATALHLTPDESLIRIGVAYQF